jgi:hypothetical protein
MANRTMVTKLPVFNKAVLQLFWMGVKAEALAIAGLRFYAIDCFSEEARVEVA